MRLKLKKYQISLNEVSNKYKHKIKMYASTQDWFICDVSKRIKPPSKPRTLETCEILYIIIYIIIIIISHWQAVRIGKAAILKPSRTYKTLSPGLSRVLWYTKKKLQWNVVKHKIFSSSKTVK